MDQINLTPNDLLLIIGNKTVELHVAQSQLAQAQATIKTLQESVEKMKEVKKED